MKNMWDYLVFDKTKPSEEAYDKYLEALLKQRNTVDAMDAANHYNISSDWNGLEDGSSLLGLIEEPVLVLWGKEGRLTPESMVLEMMEDFKSHGNRAKLAYLESGHFPFIDQLDEVMKEIRDFLK